MAAKQADLSKTITSSNHRVLAEKNKKHRIYQCEHNIIHVDWGEHRLIYCPGDFIGLSFILSSLSAPCEMECTHGEACPGEDEDGIVYLQYGSVQLPFTREDCLNLHTYVREAVMKLIGTSQADAQNLRKAL